MDSSSSTIEEQVPSGQVIDLNKPIKISSVNFEGVKRTRPKILGLIISDIFKSTTLYDFVERSTQVKSKLDALKVFSTCSFDVQLKQADKDDIDKYDVILTVQERGRMVAHAETAVDNHSTHLNIQLELPNLNGIGDSVQLNSKFNKRLYSGECRYSVPIVPWRTLWAPKYSISYSQYQWDTLPSGYDQDDKAIINTIDFLSLPNLHHSICFENIWRYIKSSSIDTPIEVREQCGHSIKSSLKHILTWDNRLGGRFPHEGVHANLSNELTTNLVNGGAKFTRHEMGLQFNSLILPKYDLIFQMNAMAGTLLRAQKINICDRFFAGGPLTLRGFKFQGLQPTVKGFPLGNSSYLSAGVHLYSILPYTTVNSPINEFLRPHIFFNTGTLGETPDIRRLLNKEDCKKEVLRFADNMRYSCGFGLVMYFFQLRFELNYCIPLVFKPNDITVKGMQWGFGVSYT